MDNPKGYMNAVHVFGRSMMGRLGQTRHLQWQWRNKSKPLQTISLTKKQYDDIKKLLGPIDSKAVNTLTEYSNSIRIYHTHTAKYYMRVKRYIKKEGLI
jgi:hypothetical protein